jgi:Domain of unknown function (DUF4421)
MRFLKLIVLVGTVGILYQPEVLAQYDTSFYRSYPNKITTRFYFSNKYTIVRFKSNRENYNLRYEPNTSINIGVGATYKWATLNLGVGFLNRNPAKGRTRYLDLQFHNYGRKFTLDLLGQFYHGFYLFPRGSGSRDNNFYRRPDLRVNEMGGIFQYVLNNKHFSYRAAFLQNEWQKKSSGSILVGLEVYGGRLLADSSIVPTLVNAAAAKENIRRVGFFEFGPNVGYAYTLVIKKHYFLTGSAALSLDYVTNTVESDAGIKRTSGFSPNRVLRAAAGYNSFRWELCLFYIDNGGQGAINKADRQLSLNAGNYRIIYVRRLIPRASQKKVLKAIK